MKLADEVLALLDDGGALSRRLPGYEKRPQQLELAAAIAECVADSKTLVAEAGTGVGKSFAYLLPAILWADREGKQIVVSTRTKALQEQLANKDLPFLQSVLPIEFTWMVAVGRNNYLCMRRLDHAIQDKGGLFRDESSLSEMEHILHWSERRDIRGIAGELPFVPDGRVWAEVQAEQGNCLGQQCHFYGPCFWQRAKRRMQTARILVVNHALYFADLALRVAGIKYLPDHELVVFDEAHHLENIASEALGLRLSPSQVEWQLGRLLTRDLRRGLFVRHGLGVHGHLVDQARDHAQRYFAQVEQCFESRVDHSSQTLRLAPGTQFADLLSPALGDVASLLDSRAGQLDHDQALELRSRASQLGALAERVQAFAEVASDNEVRWIERERKQLVLRAAPIRVAEHLSEELFGKLPRCVLTSATLGPAEGGFAWLRSRLGIADASTLRVGSPFPYSDNVELELCESLPDPSSATRDFEREANRLILERCLANEGRALVLFTSWRFLRECADTITQPLTDAGIQVLVQGDEPLPSLIEKKKANPNSVLLGTDSLWEGIDIPGDAVTLVILTRFPFPVPTHPLTAARQDEIQRQGRSSFSDYSLPQAILKFCQGFGRLVRSGSDRGKVIVLDPRVRRKAYGRRFLDALPRCREAEPGK